MDFFTHTAYIQTTEHGQTVQFYRAGKLSLFYLNSVATNVCVTVVKLLRAAASQPLHIQPPRTTLAVFINFYQFYQF